jgi:hypothetical protein
VKVPRKYMKDVPSVCFGRPKGPLRRVLGEWGVDKQVSIRAYGDESGQRAAALVSKQTCMPFAFGMHGGDKKAELDLQEVGNEHGSNVEVPDLAAHLARHLLGWEGAPEDEFEDEPEGEDAGAPRRKSFLGMLFQNGTSDAPGSDVFSPPTRCNKA